MAVCEAHLLELVRRIEPTQTQKDGAVRSQNFLREILNTGNMADRIQRSYLSGSYMRDTAVYPLDDVDIVFVIDPSFWLERENTLLRTILLGTATYPSPSRVLESFANAIRYRYPISSVFGQRRSVRLELYHLDIDVVPAIEDKGNPQFIRIPDSNANHWILSSPIKHSENATRANRLQNGKFKPLVKLLKHWNYNLPSTARFKPFAIETMAVRVFGSFKFGSLQQGLRYFFDFIAYVTGNPATFVWKESYGISLRWANVKIPDAAETGSNLGADINEERRRRFAEHAVRSRNRMNEADSTLSLDTARRRVSEALKV